MISLTPSQSKWFCSLKKELRIRTNILDLFSITEIIQLHTDVVQKATDMFELTVEHINWSVTYIPVVCQYEGFYYGVICHDNSCTFIKLWKIDTSPVLSINDTLIIDKEFVENYNESEPCVSTIGRYIANYFLYIHPFHNLIPYHNAIFDLMQVEQNVAELYLSKQVDLEAWPMDQPTPHDHFMNNFFHLSFGYGDIFVPVFSLKSLQTSPAVIKRRDELLEQYKDQLSNESIAIAIEDELIALDKEWLKDDPSYGFFGSDGKKFNVHRKSQFIVGGLSESFGDEEISTVFVKGALSDGWQTEELPLLFNNIRRASHDRGTETAKGGEQSKFLLRIFQNTIIKEDNCGTTRGLTFKLTSRLAPLFVGRYLVQKDKLILLDESNINQYVDKEVTIRSLMYCTSKPGGCYKCAGHIFEQLGTKVIGIFSIDIGSTFLLESMKAMHGKKTNTLELENLTDFMVDINISL